MSDEDTENNAQTSADPCQNSLYKSVDLKPGQIHELVIKNNDPKSVLTWDFDVVRSDLHFTVFRTIKSVSHMNGKMKYTLFEIVKPIKKMFLFLVNRSVSVRVRFEWLRWGEKLFPCRTNACLSCQRKCTGKYLFYLLNPQTLNVIFRLQCSVQGSHVMTQAGVYVLQWVCPPSCDQVAQLMFFHETLSSVNYKGSMSSLQSGISAMSLSSSCQSRW